MNEFELTGRTRTHVVELEQPRCTLHYAVVAAFLAMRDAAASAGIGLEAASSFRDFDRQLRIWNAKWRGERPLLDRAGQPLDAASLDDAARIDARTAFEIGSVSKTMTAALLAELIGQGKASHWVVNEVQQDVGVPIPSTPR